MKENVVVMPSKSEHANGRKLIHFRVGKQAYCLEFDARIIPVPKRTMAAVIEMPQPENKVQGHKVAAGETLSAVKPRSPQSLSSRRD